jgi:zinc protease
VLEPTLSRVRIGYLPFPMNVTEIDGIPAVWTPGEGPLRAGLLLRMGTADEPPGRSGITHLLEHLVLAGMGRPGDHSNGSVDPTTTHFHVVGDDQVVPFLNGVTANLARPETGRLKDERGILAAERERRSFGVPDMLSMWRYGATGYGVHAMREIGVPAVTEGDLRAWAARFAVRGNAALWFSGPPPAGLSLALPEGPRTAAPDVRASILGPGRSYVYGNASDAKSSMLGMLCVIERGVAASTLSTVISARLIDELRVRRAVAYSPQVWAGASTATHRQLFVASDVVPGRETDATRPFLATLERIAAAPGAEGGVTDDEVAEGLQRRLTMLEECRPAEWAAHGALEILEGRPVSTLEGLREEERSVTAEAVRAVAAASQDILAVVPSGVRVPDEWTPARSAIHEPVKGRSYAWRGEGEGVLVLSPTGLTSRAGEQTATVIFEHVQAVTRRPDGYRQLIGDDAVSITIEPNLWIGGPSLVSVLDETLEGTAAERFIDLPERPASEIPRPRAAGDAAVAAGSVPLAPPSKLKFFLTSFFVSMGVLMLVIMAFALTPLNEDWLGPALLVFVGGTVTTTSSMWKDRRQAYEQSLVERI